MQIASFSVAAIYSGLWCLRWARDGGEQGMWGKLRLFSGMVCAGSIAGAVAWGAYMEEGFVFYAADDPDATPYQMYTLTASSFRFFALFLVLYGFEFMCLVISKLLVLGRLVDNATESSHADVSEMSVMRLSKRALPIVYRVMASGVVVGCSVVMVATDVGAAYSVQAAGLTDQAAASCDAAGNSTDQSLAFFDAASDIDTASTTATSVQFSIEALTLLLLSVAFLVIVSWSVALFRIVERVAAQFSRALGQMPGSRSQQNSQRAPMNAERIIAGTMQAASEHRRRLTAACVIVLITFPARAAFDLLQAYATFNSPKNPDCGICDSCQSTHFLVLQWLYYTPELQPILVAVGSPLPLTLVLWLLTKAVARARLITADVQRNRSSNDV